ncbi:hypothetical protein EBQ34_04470 [Vandammella animalimorsus]|uniref:Uncharacterized protein n=1 Tax=Vandammella animalimorsus TaxID=2029117 RepID=A0A3M6RRC2_9BURK|nr:hypothetical protein EBQ34_04470 [Vandammella animalimorsus]
MAMQMEFARQLLAQSQTAAEVSANHSAFAGRGIDGDRRCLQSLAIPRRTRGDSVAGITGQRTAIRTKPHVATGFKAL